MTTDLYRWANYGECGLWVAVGILCPLPVLKVRWTWPQRVLAAATLIAFGLSDAVETLTGAWWRPWRLLVWKGACIATILALAARAWTRRRDPQEP